MNRNRYGPRARLVENVVRSGNPHERIAIGFKQSLNLGKTNFAWHNATPANVNKAASMPSVGQFLSELAGASLRV